MKRKLDEKKKWVRPDFDKFNFKETRGGPVLSDTEDSSFRTS